MLFVRPGQSNALSLPCVSKDNGNPITSGTVSFYLYAQDGDNAGKWWRGSDATWQSSESVAGVGSHIADGHWKTSIAAGAWVDGTAYRLYLKESGGLHIASGDDVWVDSLSTASAIRTAIGLAAADLDTQLADLPTVAEFTARTLAAADYATATVVDAIQAKTDLITNSTLVTRSPVLTDGSLELSQGSAYSVATGTEISFSDSDTTWPDLSDAGTTCELQFHPITAGMYSLINSLGSVVDPCPELTVSGEVTGARAVQFELTSEETRGLTAGTYSYQAQIWVNIGGEDIKIGAVLTTVLVGKGECPT